MPVTKSEAETDRAHTEGRDPLAWLVVGHSDKITKTIKKEDLDAFAALSGDYNPLHVDDEFAARTEFEERLAHGFIHASLISTLVGMRIPHPGSALCLSHNFDFTKPVFIGDTVEATGTVQSVDPASRVITVRTDILNQKGESVLKAETRAKVLRVSGAPPVEQRRVAAMSGLLAGELALVTGASRGIGRAIASALAAHGATVCVNYNRSEGAARSLAAEIAANGGQCFVAKADVTRDDEAAEMLSSIANRGDLSILVNNAGPKIRTATFDDLAWTDFDAAFTQIVGGVFRVTRAALPSLQKSKGRIVNVLSAAALGRTAHSWLPYVTAKNALLGFSKNLAQELGPSGVRVNMVSPSMVETDLVANVPERVAKMTVGRTPLRRLATVDDVANAVVFLASSYADFITGDNLLVTGGDVMA